MSDALLTWAESRARHRVAALHSRLGAAGLAAAAVTPGLAAAVDQHAAAIRDITTQGIDNPDEVPVIIRLAGYAAGLQAQARSAGHPLTSPTHWPAADWILVRLTAICLLAQASTEPAD